MNMQILKMDEEKGSAGEGGAGGNEPDYKAQVAALQAEKEALLNKNNELLTETKKAKETRRAAEQLAEEEAKKKAEAEGNFKQLFESSEAERQKAIQERDELLSKNAKKEVKAEALKLSAKLAEGENVELMATFIERRLKYTNGAVKVTDIDGNLTVSSLDQLKEEFEGNSRYASLLKGSKSSGGGANGGANGSGAAKTVSREVFDGMSQKDRSAFSKGGGMVTD